HQYDSNGFNELINHWFQIELTKLKKEGLFISNVQSLSVVNIDSLIFNQAGLIENIYLHEIIKLYHENKKHIVNRKKHFKNKSDFDQYVSKIKQQSISKLIPFSNFIENHFIKNRFKQFPPLM